MYFCTENLLYYLFTSTVYYMVYTGVYYVYINALRPIFSYESVIKNYLYPNKRSLISLKSLPCTGFANTSAVLNFVGICVTENFSESMNCFTKKYRNFICFVRSKHDLPFFAVVIVDELSWYNLANSTLIPSD